MNTNNWARLKQRFDELCLLDEAEQVAEISKLHSEDPELAVELETLLENSREQQHSVTGMVNAAAGNLLDSQEDQIIGQQFGAYQVKTHLARGGMGDVYVGERNDGTFYQQVAIKLVRLGPTSRDAAARFAVERQILAKLNHSNIAHIIDGGTTPEGIAYFVMEFVEGESIDEYCKTHDLSIRARLKLFLSVCEAVDFAHRNLVVHRDIKPSNILITADGVPKLLDFGIAKLIGDNNQPDPAGMTQATSLIMTPDFASPEQVLGQPITTVSDIYSLGVLLYVLLTEEKPYSTSGLRPSELEKVITETLPARPSQAVAHSKRTDNSAALGNRKSWARRLRSDIDAICLKALNKEPELRYGGADRLAADVRRHLDGIPVSARGRTWTYVARKFLQRNLLAVSVACIVAVTGAVALIYHERTLTAERDQVRAEAEKSAAVSQFLIDTFQVSDPDENLGASITAKEILDAGALRLAADLAEQPGTRAVLSRTIGEVYDSMGLYTEARAQLQTASDIFAAQEELEEQAETLRALAYVEFNLGDLDASQATYERATRIARQLYPNDHAQLAVHTNDLGFIAKESGDYNTAISRYREALAMFDRLGIADSANYFNSLHDLGQVQQLAGDSASAESSLRQAMDYALERNGELNTLSLIYMSDLATVLRDLSRYSEAEELYLRVIAGERQLFGEVNSEREATLTNLGRMYSEMNRLDDAEGLLREAASISSQTRGPRHTFTAYVLVGLANLLTQKTEYAEAQQKFEDALSIYRENLQSDHPFIASAKAGYGALLNAMNEPEASLRHSDEALAICSASLPEDHWLVASILSVRGEALMLLGEMDSAEPLLINSYNELVKVFPDDRITVNALRRLVRFYELQGNDTLQDQYQQLLLAIRPEPN